MKIKPPRGRPYYIYVYLDVRDGKVGEPIYVGFSKFEEGKGIRAFEHWNRVSSYGGCHNKFLNNVLLKIKEQSMEPVIQIVRWFSSEDRAKKYEQSLIKKYGRRVLSKGSLCNLTNGGDGSLGLRHTEEFKKWNSKRAKEQFKDPEQVKIQQEMAKKRWQDPIYREKCTIAIQKRSNDESYLENMRQKVKTGWTEEVRKKKSEAQKTPEFLKMRAEFWTEEQRKAHSELMKEIRRTSLSWPKAKERPVPKQRHEWVGNAKIDEWGVRFIRYWQEKGWSQVSIAETFGITQAQISNIILGNSWKHVV